MSDEEVKVIDISEINIRIPQCCEEGWDDCPHAVQKVREKPKNIAL